MTEKNQKERTKEDNQTAVLDSKWLGKKSKEELLDLMLQITLELKTRMSRETTKAPAISEKSGAFPDVTVEDIDEFTRVPANNPESDVKWRVMLIPEQAKLSPMGLDIVAEVSVGRSTEEKKVGVDLSDYKAAELGVSREHAKLRPTKDALLLFDIGSTNGTFYNGNRIKLGQHFSLQDGDVISFGALHFKVKIVTKS